MRLLVLLTLSLLFAIQVMRRFLPSSVECNTKRKAERNKDSITIITVPAATANTSAAEDLAFHSWLALSPRPFVVLVASTTTVAHLEAVAHLHNGVIVAELPLGSGYALDHVPSLPAVISTAEAAAPTDILAFVNADVLLGPSFAVAALACAVDDRALVMTGARRDCAPPRSLSSAAAWERLSAARQSSDPFAAAASTFRCTPHPPTGKDYFVFERGFWDRAGGIPAFGIGWKQGAAYDNFLLELALRRGEVVDASAVVDALHIDHAKAHLDSHGRRLKITPDQMLNLRLSRAALMRHGVNQSQALRGLTTDAPLLLCPRACAGGDEEQQALQIVARRDVSGGQCSCALSEVQSPRRSNSSKREG